MVVIINNSCIRWSNSMIKITIETDEEIIGVKDKNAWTLEDAISLVELAFQKSSFSFDGKRLDIVDKLPITPIAVRAEEEGM